VPEASGHAAKIWTFRTPQRGKLALGGVEPGLFAFEQGARPGDGNQASIGVNWARATFPHPDLHAAARLFGNADEVAEDF